MKPLMDKTEAEPILRAVSGGLVDEKQERFLKSARHVVAKAVPKDIGSHGAGNIRDLVERTSDCDLLQNTGWKRNGFRYDMGAHFEYLCNPDMWVGAQMKVNERI